ncbi:hypothetical protein AWB74_08553 [Caballeronia arvi]|uniref:Uncharacterized protein n=1 Tax=Caballeronia arvi TaxID=1777135 RepID=A0A158L564_9BURK|nr:hypothetical protein AWB74_08553 [Caballeronia arvi]
MADIEQFKDDLEDNPDGIVGGAGATSWKPWVKPCMRGSQMTNGTASFQRI